MFSIGLMSGTSMDGIDAALLETDGQNEVRELANVSITYEPEFKLILKATEQIVRHYQGDLNQVRKFFSSGLKNFSSNLAQEINPHINYDEIIQHSTELHLQAVRKLLQHTAIATENIAVVGYHGQTFFHSPTTKTSVIAGNAQYLADQLGIAVVADFRHDDINAGGQGAPFAPLYHQALAIRDNKFPLAVVNCGGIANITLIYDNNPENLIAFDTGPGNGLIDRYIRQKTLGKETMDKDGQYGSQGKVSAPILQLLYEKSVIQNHNNFFSLPLPKSLDIGDMQLISEIDNLSFNDACATLEAFTADSIIKAAALSNHPLPLHWILAGGGWHNPVILHELISRLKKILPEACIQTANEAGWNGQALEAQIFAYLAIRNLKGLPLSYPGTTGVPLPMPGGKVFKPTSLQQCSS